MRDREEEGLYRLRKPLPPEPGESLGSLVMRNAAPYHFQQPLWLLSQARVTAATLPHLMEREPSSDVVRRLAALLGVDTPVLRQLAAWGSSEDDAQVLGVPVPARFIDLRQRRGCAACLRESAHHRAVWDVASLTTCSVHHRPLIDRCPGCGGTLRWYGFQVSRCGNPECNTDLSRIEDDTPIAPFAHIRGLTDLLMGGPGATLPGSGLQFGEALEACHVLGRLLIADRLPKRTTGFLRARSDDLVEGMEAGWGALMDWPSGFERALESLREGASARGLRHGLRQEFGALPRWFSTGGSAPWAAPLRSAFAAFIAAQDNLRLKGATLAKYGLSEETVRGHLTLQEAARALGLTQSRMRAIAEREDLYTVRRSGVGAPSLLWADRVAALVEKKAANLTKGEAAEELGVGRPVVLDFLAQGMLRQVPGDELVDYRRSIPRTEVQGLTERVRACVVPIEGRRRLQPLTLAGRTRMTIVELLQAVLDGRIAPRGLGEGRGLGALLFDPLEVGLVSPARVGTMSVAEAAVVLLVDEKNAHLWVQHGLLPTEDPQERERGRRITTAGLKAFEGAFITSTEISKRLGCGSFAVSRRLTALGITTLVPGSKTPIYPRALVTEEVLGDLAGVIAAASTSPEEHVDEAGRLRERVLAAAAQKLAVELRHEGRGYVSDTGEVAVEVAIGIPQPFLSRSVFRLYEAAQRRLARTPRGYLAIGFVGLEVFALVPWPEVESIFGEEALSKQRIPVLVDLQGRVGEPGLERFVLPTQSASDQHAAVGTMKIECQQTE